MYCRGLKNDTMWSYRTDISQGLVGSSADTNNSTRASSRRVFSKLIQRTNTGKVFSALRRKYTGLDYNSTDRYTVLRHIY